MGFHGKGDLLYPESNVSCGGSFVSNFFRAPLLNTPLIFPLASEISNMAGYTIRLILKGPSYGRANLCVMFLFVSDRRHASTRTSSPTHGFYLRRPLFLCRFRFSARFFNRAKTCISFCPDVSGSVSPSVEVGSNSENSRGASPPYISSRGVKPVASDTVSFIHDSR
jgi:hypothetical protein